MEMMIEMLDLDFVVLSHGHIDHAGGLFHLLQAAFEARIGGLPHRDPPLVARPFCFYPRLMEGVFEFGSPVSRDVWERSFPICLSDRPVRLTDDLVFPGGIERTNGFEYREPIGRILTPEEKRPDRQVDDSPLAFRSEDGLVHPHRVLPFRHLQYHRVCPESLWRGVCVRCHRRSSPAVTGPGNAR